MKPITEQTPSEIDTQIAKLEEPLGQLFAQVQSCRSGIEDRKANPKRYAYYSATTIEQLEAQIVEIQAKIQAVRDAIAPFEAEYVRRGCWTRYFLVFGGHVHRERNCSSCHWNTLFGWLPGLSGCDELAMVAEHGDNACAICFPAVQQHPAFLAAKALRLAAEAKLAAEYCPGSGKRGTDGRKYTPCPVCKQYVYAGPRGYGKLRKHKVAKA